VPVIEKDGAIREWVGVCTDITERKRHEEELVVVQTRMVEALRAQAVRDPLTGLFNRQYLDETLLRELRQSRRRKAPLSLGMLDIDHFKIFNDTYGHAAGDEVLKELGKLLRDTVRTSDIACRYGGEEFVLVLLDADLAAALPSVERIFLEIKRKQCVYRGQTLPSITLSAGLAQYPVHGTSPEELLRAADEAMYAAKNAGRDRIEISSAHPERKPAPTQV
jgi:diguanylate cyclase (GGDEF)-like protein